MSLQFKSVDWFLCEGDTDLKWFKSLTKITSSNPQEKRTGSKEGSFLNILQFKQTKKSPFSHFLYCMIEI